LAFVVLVTMGAGIAIVVARAGCETACFDRNMAQLKKAKS